MGEKLYYIYFDINWGPGIINKINMHCKYFSKMGFLTIKISIQRVKNKYLRTIKKVFPFCSEFYFDELSNIPDNSNLYIRYNGMSFKFYRILCSLKNRGCRIFIEIPTFPYDDEETIFSRLLNYKDYLWRNKLSRIVHYFVTFSKDSTIFGTPTLRVSNCIDISTICIRKFVQSSHNEINAIAVATFSPWHGYDRIIEGMRDYYKEGIKKYNFKLHLVGDGIELEKYKSLVIKYSLDNYVIFYGKQMGDKLDRIYDMCDIAFDALGRHRSGVEYNSSLKGKEYLAKGIPIVSGVNTELDYDTEFRYYMRIPADESPVNIDKVCEFLMTLYNDESADEISANIRKYAENNFDISIVYNQIVRKIKQY